jgi:hypothetical protein
VKRITTTEIFDESAEETAEELAGVDEDDLGDEVDEADVEPEPTEAKPSRRAKR